MQLSQEIRDRFMKVEPAAIGHHITSGYMHPRIKPVFDEAKLVGPAFTVRLTERDGAALYAAMKMAPKGAVLVVDKGGDPSYACVGEFFAEMAKACGIAGMVVDGPATDKIALKQMKDFPVFCTGFSPATTMPMGVSGDIGIPVDCGGAVVRPGDIILGDADGVIVVPEDYMPYLEAAEAKAKQETELREKIRNGFVYNKRADFDPVKFWQADIAKVIADAKNEFKF